jgi:hypothetical protein
VGGTATLMGRHDLMNGADGWRARRTYPTPPFLPNEASCNVEENAFIWLGEKQLRRLQKNDNWLRFCRKTGLKPLLESLFFEN